MCQAVTVHPEDISVRVLRGRARVGSFQIIIIMVKICCIILHWLWYIDIYQIVLISLFPTPFDHFHFHGSGGLILWYDFRLWHMYLYECVNICNFYRFQLILFHKVLILWWGCVFVWKNLMLLTQASTNLSSSVRFPTRKRFNTMSLKFLSQNNCLLNQSTNLTLG